MTETNQTAPAPTTSNADALSVSSPNAAAPAAQAAPVVQKDTANQAPQAADAAKAVGDKAPDAPQGAPDKYEFKPVEGRTLDSETMSTFAEVAKELGLTQDSAQKILDRMAPQMAQRQQAQIESIRTEWVEASKTDAEFGGDKIAENLAVAKKALDQFGTPELRALLNESGLGNHPEIIRLMYRAGKSISEDTYVGRSAGTGGKPLPKSFADAASALYPNPN
jgi:hypothetical protein